MTGLGFTLPRETVQPALDAFTVAADKNYPMGIHADSVQVTDSGVVSQFSTQNAVDPQGRRRPLLPAVGCKRAQSEPVEHRAGAGQPQPGGAGVEHGDGVGGGADAAAGLDPEPGADGRGHQLDGAHRRAAARVKSGGGLHEIGAGVLGGPAHVDQRLLAAEAQQRRRLDDHLEDDVVAVSRRRTAAMSARTASKSPAAPTPTSITMSISSAPGRDGEPRLLGLDRRKMFA